MHQPAVWKNCRDRCADQSALAKDPIIIRGDSGFVVSRSCVGVRRMMSVMFSVLLAMPGWCGPLAVNFRKPMTSIGAVEILPAVSGLSLPDAQILELLPTGNRKGRASRQRSNPRFVVTQPATPPGRSKAPL